jgi:mannose-6-phosphate isomerase-like protein (cupin superfamily)
MVEYNRGRRGQIGNLLHKYDKLIDANMTKTIAVLLFVAAAAFPAGDPAGFHVWKSSQMDADAKTLATKLDANHVASETLDTIGNRVFMVAHREGPGQAEWHEKQADVIVIHSGAVTLVYGGEVVGGKTTAPGEIRGNSIKGGTEVTLGPGDALHIPAKVPHLMKVAPGQSVTYFIVKVVE